MKDMRQMERRESFDKAQEDLNQYAKSKGWKPIAKQEFNWIEER